jgi:hypothetical protein
MLKHCEHRVTVWNGKRICPPNRHLVCRHFSRPRTRHEATQLLGLSLHTCCLYLSATAISAAPRSHIRRRPPCCRGFTWKHVFIISVKHFDLGAVAPEDQTFYPRKTRGLFAHVPQPWRAVISLYRRLSKMISRSCQAKQLNLRAIRVGKPELCACASALVLVVVRSRASFLRRLLFS